MSLKKPKGEGSIHRKDAGGDSSIHSRQNAIPTHLRDLDALLRLDRRLKAVHRRAGDFPLRTLERGFGGLARIVVGQQVSVASANAIWARFKAMPNATTPGGFLELSQSDIATIGLSRTKFATLTNLASLMASGKLHLDAVSDMSSEIAIAELTKLKGIGPWSAEIYLMCCAGHSDIFPVGDLALQRAVSLALRTDALRSRKSFSELTTAWTPYRSTAAFLFWQFYAVVNRRQTLPI